MLSRPSKIFFPDVIPLGTSFQYRYRTYHGHRLPGSKAKSELDKIAGNYEFIFIDCPLLSWLTINTLTASDKVIVVVSSGYFELDSYPFSWVKTDNDK